MMFLDGYGKSNRQRFFPRHVARRRVSSFRHNHFSGFSRLGDRNLLSLHLGHAAGFVSVPWPATGLKAGPPTGGRESDQTNQQEYDASHKQPLAMRDDSLHVFVEESQKKSLEYPTSHTAIGLAGRQECFAVKP